MRLDNEAVDIRTEFCDHCHDAIDRIPDLRGPESGVQIWYWIWVHHNSGSITCNCTAELARPSERVAVQS